MLTLAKRNNIELTGENQHGYKNERSTVTAAPTIQSSSKTGKVLAKTKQVSCNLKSKTNKKYNSLLS
jgi:hypothetical protein